MNLVKTFTSIPPNISENIIQYAKNNNVVSCKDCKFLKLSKYSKEYDSIYDNAGCRKFGITHMKPNEPIEVYYELAKTCRKLEYLCGKDARYYEKK